MDAFRLAREEYDAAVGPIQARYDALREEEYARHEERINELNAAEWRETAPHHAKAEEVYAQARWVRDEAFRVQEKARELARARWLVAMADAKG